MDYALPIEENHQHALHTRLLKSQFFRPWSGFSDPCSGLTFSGRIVGKTPRLIASYNLLKEVRITVCCGNQQKAVTSTLNTTAKNDFCKDIQKLYDGENLCVQLEGMYVEN